MNKAFSFVAIRAYRIPAFAVASEFLVAHRGLVSVGVVVGSVLACLSQIW